MKKLVLKCPKCKKKMKINDKPAKYRCPHCKNIYKYTLIKKIFSYPGRGIRKVINFFSRIKNRIILARNAAKYMAQVRKNMKQNPNWSNVQAEKNRMKEVNKGKKRSFFSRFKK